MLMPGESGDMIRTTGGQVDDITVALIDAAYDKDGNVQPVVSQSLYDLGIKKPKLVLSSSHSYLKKHPKLCQAHRVIILNVIERIIKDCLNDVDAALSADIINQATNELTQSKDVQPEWQTAASGVLVAIGMKYCDDVMDVLLQKFQPGVLPHFFVIKTLSNLSVANVYGMVPHLTAVLGTMLPMMGMVKQDNMRWVFSSAVCKFSEAILDYLANIESAPDKSVTKYSFSSAIFSAYDVLFNVWLQSKEIRLQLTIVEAVGYMTHLMTRENLEEQLPKLIQGFLGLYRRHTEGYYITQGLCMVLDAACDEGSFILDPHLDNVLGALYTQACTSPDYKNPMSLKNHNEVMRCFAVIARCFSSKLLGWLLLKLESTNEKVRIGTLSIIKHLINAASVHMEDKKEVVVSGLKPMTLGNSNKVKKVFAQVVIAMAHHRYLELEGGQQMVEFIVSNCSLPPDTVRPSGDPEYVTNDSLKQMCDHVLTLITTTIEHMESVLWPYLLETIVPDKYTTSASVVCQNLAYLAKKKRDQQTDDFMIDFESDANIPKPANLVSRLFVLAGRPTHGKNRGVNVLTLMQALSPIIHENLVTLWDTIIPKLVKFLQDQESSDDPWNQKVWEDLILKMLSKSLDEIDDEDWLHDLGSVMGEDIILYLHLPEEKNILLKCLGIVLRKSTNKNFVAENLELIFKNIKHASQLEREGCAVSFGFISASHLDSVLTKLENVAKYDLSKKSGVGLFGNFKKEKNPESDPEKVKATLMLCYGFVMLFGPITLIVSRFETTVIRTINPHFTTTKDTIVKQNLIRTTELIAQALHPDHLATNYVFKAKGDFIVHLQNYMKTESMLGLNNETRALALNACTELVKLDPPLSDIEIYHLVRAATDCLMSLPIDGMAPRKGKDESYDDILEIEVLLEESFKSLHQLLTQILHNDVQPYMLFNIYDHLVSWMLSIHDHERERATHTFHVLLQYYYNHMEIGVVTKATQMSNMGILLGRMVPRVTDPSVAVRHHAIDSIYCLLKISRKYEGLGGERDSLIEKLKVLRERLEKTDPTILFSVVNDLAKIIAKTLPNDQLPDLIELLKDALVDPQSHSSSGACVVLNCVMKLRGAQILTMVDQVLSSLHYQLPSIHNPQTRAGTLRSIRTMASHHLIPVLSALLNYTQPFDEYVVDMIHVMCEDEQLVTSMLEHLLDLAQRSLPYEEKVQPKDKTNVTRVATTLPIAMFSVMTEIFRVSTSREPVMKMFHRIFSAILVRIGAMVLVQAPKTEQKRGFFSRKPPDTNKMKDKKKLKSSVCSLSIETLQAFLELTNCDEVLEELNSEGCWEMLDNELLYAHAVTIIAKAICDHKPEYIGRIVSCMTSSLSSLYERQRVVVAAFFSELINQKCGGDGGMAELLMNSLLGRLVDPTQEVRVYCIRGMGNIASMGPQQVQRFATTVLSAMMAGMDDKEDIEDNITVEAMRGLSKVLSEIDERDIRAILINIALRIRPCFEKERPSVRAQAILLFGNLSRFGGGPSRAPFLEQIHSNFVALLLHLNDGDTEVRKACKTTLRMLGPLLESDSINDMFQKHLFEDANLFYGEFINNLSKSIIKDCRDKVNFYVMGCVSFFKSNSPDMRANAALFVGFLLGNLPKSNHCQISKEHICSALILLLKDTSPQVRISAAESMSRLYEY